MRKIHSLTAALVFGAAAFPARANTWADYQCVALRETRPLIRNPLRVTCRWPGATVYFRCDALAASHENDQAVDAEVFSERCRTAFLDDGE